MKKKSVSMLLATAMVVSLLTGCGSKNNSAADTTKEETKTEATAEAAVDESNDTTADNAGEETTITVFAAKSLNQVMEELITKFQETHPNVNVQGSYDSSGTLLTQIEEGAACDVFFSAAVKQMDQLDETDGLVVDGTRHNVVNNQVCLVTYKESNTEVTSLEELNKASSIALADGSVPVGKYTRQALVNAGILEKADDVSTIPTATVSEALGGVEINECANVGAVTSAVAEGSNEVGTVYYSDTYGLEDRLEILQVIPYDLTGDVIYPVAQVLNPEAEELVMNELRGNFRPEFLNRLDEIIMFKPLTKDNIGNIIHLLMNQLNKRLEDREISVELTPAAENFIVEHGYDPIYGARPLKRFLQKHVETLSAKLILADEVHANDVILIDVDGDHLTARVK